MDGLQKVIIPMTLDLLRRSNQQIAVVNVGEAASRQLEIALTRGRIPFIPGEELSVTVYALKPDGTKVFSPCELRGNIVRMNITTQMTAASGVIKCNLRIGTAESVLFSSMFYLESYDTVFSDAAVESTDEFTALSQALRYQHIRYAPKKPTANSDMTEDPDDLTAYIGVAVTLSPEAPHDYTKYKWCSYRGKPGAIFTPHVSEDGILSWTNDQNLDNPTPVNIKGPTGDIGPTGPTGAQGKTGPAGIVISETEPTDESHPVWIRPSGEYIVENLGISGATVGQVPAVKAVDENGVPTEWEAADGDGDSKPFVVTVTYGDDDTLTADKTHAEIVEAYSAGAQINAKIVNYPGVMVPSILPLYVNISDEMFMFSGSGVLDGSAMAMTAIDTNGSWRVELAKIATLDDIPTEVFTINLAADSGGNIASDKTFAEIEAAYYAGKVVDAKFEDAIVPLRSISDSDAIFEITQANSAAVVTVRFTCTSDNVWSMSQNGFDASTTLGISGAAAGQTVTIKAVDAAGIPTEWEATDKMDKSNPTGTGSFSLNRKSGTTVGDYSHAEGSSTTASGYASHAEGYVTTASGQYGSHAEGSSTTASGEVSHAEGSGTKAASANQHVQGKFNIEDSSNTYADIIGNGTGNANTKRSNAATVDWSGNAWYAGDVYVGSTSGTNKDAGSKKLATEEYVDSAVSGGLPLGISGASVGQIVKIKTVDGDGKPTEWEAGDASGGSGTNGEKLLVEYVHSSNEMYQPTSFDPETGIFTCPSHGLVGNTGCFAVMNNDAAFDTTKVPKGNYGATLVPVDNDSFKINGWDYASDENVGNIDCSSFHYEHCVTFTIKDIPLYKKIRVVMLGKVFCGSWLGFDCSLLSGTLLFDTADTGSYFMWGRPGYAYGRADGIFFLDSDIFVGDNETVATRKIWRADSNNNNKQFQNYLARKKNANTGDSFEITSSYSGISEQGFANGFVVKVYGYGGDNENSSVQ